MRIAKFICAQGYCSRRKAEELIFEKRVALNGVIIDTPVYFVTNQDNITIDNKPLALENSKEKLWIYYKPVGEITTHEDPQGRVTVFEKLPTEIGRVISVGRLDVNSEGLLLLTNSGHLANKLSLPANNYKRIYKVRARGIGQEAIEEIVKFNKGLIVEGINCKPVNIKILSGTSYNRWFLVTLYEGKNREIRKLFTHIGLEVNRLIRISFGKFELDDMLPGELREVKI